LDTVQVSSSLQVKVMENGSMQAPNMVCGYAVQVRDSPHCRVPPLQFSSKKGNPMPAMSAATLQGLHVTELMVLVELALVVLLPVVLVSVVVSTSQ
jgi:hypothetical protein